LVKKVAGFYLQKFFVNILENIHNILFDSTLILLFVVWF
jgi:hypothetical protein